MNQTKMNLDNAHPPILVEALAKANRLRRCGAGLGGFLFAAICLLLPSPAEAQCPQWDVSGKWQLEQSDGLTVTVDLRQSGKTVTGTAVCYTTKAPTGLFAPLKGDNPHTLRGPVTGNIAGDDFFAEITWSYKSIGVYRGKVGPQGRIEGTVYDKGASPKKMTWVSPNLMKCQEQISASTSPAPTASPKRVISHKGKGPTTVNAPETAEPAAAKDKLQSGNPQDFAGTWNTTRRGENLILTLRVDGTNVTGEFTNPSRPTSNGTLTGTVKTYDGNSGPIVKLSYVTTQPTAGDGSFNVFADGRLEGGFTWREPGKAKKTFIRWNGTRASN
jgi:hypothetical protein